MAKKAAVKRGRATVARVLPAVTIEKLDLVLGSIVALADEQKRAGRHSLCIAFGKLHGDLIGVSKSLRIYACMSDRPRPICDDPDIPF